MVTHACSDLSWSKIPHAAGQGQEWAGQIQSTLTCERRTPGFVRSENNFPARCKENSNVKQIKSAPKKGAKEGGAPNLKGLLRGNEFSTLLTFAPSTQVTVVLIPSEVQTAFQVSPKVTLARSCFSVRVVYPLGSPANPLKFSFLCCVREIAYRTV